jgi:DNA sulfur modification protein DndD
MRLIKVGLQNVGAYGGEHQLEFADPGQDRPITLVGALNGGGKTTLLESLQLCLYGKLAPHVRSSAEAYDKYLRGLVHRDADPDEGALVELHFTIPEGERETSYVVQRHWVVDERQKVRESLHVVRSRELDPELARNWTEHMESILPCRLAHLFFFDGERIQQFADPEKSSDLLSAALDALLGLDLLETTQRDLVALERRQAREMKSEFNSTQLDRIEEELSSLRSARESQIQTLGTLRNDIDRARRNVQDAEIRLRNEGSEELNRRPEIERAHLAATESRDEARAALRVLAEGDLPFTLLQAELKECLRQVQVERESRLSGLVLGGVKERDSKLLSLIEREEGGLALSETVRQFLEEDRDSLRKRTEVECYLDALTGDENSLIGLLEARLPMVESSLEEQLDTLEVHEEELTRQDRRLSRIPSEEALADLLASFEQARAALLALEAREQQTIGGLETLSGQIERMEGQLESELRSLREGEITQSDGQRFLQHSKRARDTLEVFRSRLVSRHTQHLAALILDSFQSLVRKSDLVHQIELDPESRVLRLLDSKGRQLEPRRLSAGERQLLAVSILWALARASGRSLPTIIDTPLGRLDGTHRTNLVERYFPFASSQVVLLSTDTEIDEAFFDQLGDHIGRSYRIEHDDRNRSSHLTSGYFW